MREYDSASIHAYARPPDVAAVIQSVRTYIPNLFIGE